MSTNFFHEVDLILIIAEHYISTAKRANKRMATIHFRKGRRFLIDAIYMKDGVRQYDASRIYAAHGKLMESLSYSLGKSNPVYQELNKFGGWDLDYLEKQASLRTY